MHLPTEFKKIAEIVYEKKKSPGIEPCAITKLALYL